MSVRELIRNQKYQLEIPIGYNGNKRIRHYETFYGSKKDAVIREARVKIQLKEGSYIQKTHLTIQDLSEEYLKYQKGILAPKTYLTYAYRMNVINEHLGHIKLQHLNVKILESFYNYLRSDYFSSKGEKLSPTTIQSYYAIINNMLSTAVEWEYLNYNVNARIPKPKRAKTNIQCYSPGEVVTLLKCLPQEPLKYQALILLALDLGCRRGELTGLTWDDIDFDTRKVSINKTTQSVYEKIIEKERKTENSNRYNIVSRTTINVLKKYKQDQLIKQMELGSKWIKTNRVFTGLAGSDMHPDSAGRIFQSIIKRHNLKRITFHGLRHTSVSLMIAKGVPLSIISRKVGHSSIQITDKFYSHFFDEEFKRAADVMDEVFSMAY